MWNVKNVSTSEYKIIIFIRLHSTQEYSVVQRIDALSRSYRNEYIINFIGASYVKTENTTILEWLHIIMEVIYRISKKYANIH